MSAAAELRPAGTARGTAGGRPSNVVVVLLDSLNRHMLGCYGGTEFETPNLDRFARERAVRFTSHVTGSLPCMPARHDILRGSLDFLWRPWESIEVWEEPDRRARLDFMPGSDAPVIRQPFEPGDRLPFWVGHGVVGRHFLFDVSVDLDEDENLVGTRAEAEMVDLLRVTLQDVDTPDEQLQRLGIA